MSQPSKQLDIKRAREKFLSLCVKHPRNACPKGWKRAFNQFVESEFKGVLYENYIDALLTEFALLVNEDQILQNLLPKILEQWFEIVAYRVAIIAQTNERYSNELSIRGKPRERNKILNTIRPWVNAYKQLQTIPFVKSRPKDVTLIYYLVFNNDIYDSIMNIREELIFERIRLGMVASAWERFGPLGKRLAESALTRGDGRQGAQPINQRRIVRKGRKEDFFLNQWILELDMRNVGRDKIIRIIDALSTDKSKSGFEVDDVYQFQPRRKRRITRSQYRAQKKLQMRINRLGGNVLRYYADRCAEEFGECLECKWGWTRDSDLVAVLPCARHARDRKAKISELLDRELVRRALSFREESYFSNALSWTM